MEQCPGASEQTLITAHTATDKIHQYNNKKETGGGGGGGNNLFQ